MEIINTIIQTVQECISNDRCSSGNFLSSVGSEKDKLVQLCHGAPGWIPLLTFLSTLTNTHQYDDYIEQCGRVVWERGLLASKGPGICHGISGSICSFVDLFYYFHDQKWLIKAKMFGTFLAGYWPSLISLADRPYSLFEGIGGTYYAFSVLENIDNETYIHRISSFPGFTG